MSEFQFVPPVATTAKPRRQPRRRWWWWAAAGLLLIILAVAGWSVWYYNSLVYQPAQASGKLIQVTIAEGLSVPEIGEQLAKEGIVRDARVFALYVRWSGTSTGLQSGNFQIPQNISMRELVQKLQAAKRDEAVLRFIEGWRREEMAEYIDSQHNQGLIDMTGAQFSAMALTPTDSLRAMLGNRLPADASLQGFLFPDTYVVNKDETPEQLLTRMITTYKKRVSADMLAGFERQGLSEYEAVTLAAIVERESHQGEERAIIAGILLSRLKAGIPLYVDATLQYMLGYSDAEKKWWRQGLTVDDIAVDSVYNTRLHAGLPPAPICNPGLSALQAVANPTDSDYLYYIHDTDGVAHYAKTLDEHNANIAEYLR
jgi:UPF0755 protein